MNFLKVITNLTKALDDAKVRYALIGGFAMALRGEQRTTAALDFILVLDDLATADTLFNKLGYTRIFHSENVSHYESKAHEWGRIDILHAFRAPSLSMIERADRIALTDEVSLPVVQREDLIGLKIQALVNDPARAARDWLDIYLLLKSAGERQYPVDWNLIEEYLAIFNLSAKLPELKIHYSSSA